MGLLDDAIREHLALKRARGAPSEELDHLEQEALGPARREADGDEPEAAGTPDAAPEPVAEAVPEPEPAPEPEPEIPVAEEPEDVTPEPEPAAPAWEIAAEELADEPEPVLEASEELEELDEVEELEGEDVLEETPEFLQETPEHDRLWFEQKPPRDFDFDR